MYTHLEQLLTRGAPQQVQLANIRRNMSEAEERESLIVALQQYLLSNENKSTMVGRVITINKKEGEQLSEIDQRELRFYAEWAVDLIEKAIRFEQKTKLLSRMSDLQEGGREGIMSEMFDEPATA